MHLRRKIRHAGIFVLCAVLGIGFFLLHGIFLHTSVLTQKADAFYGAEMRGIDTSVVLHGVTYVVSDGTIATTHAGAPDTSGIFALAYARELAERAPLLDLSGTDPDELRNTIKKLSDTQAELARAQNSPGNSDLVAGSLYPTRFLSTLADLESARLAFIASGSDNDEKKYAKALSTAAAQGLASLQSLIRAYNVATDNQSVEQKYAFLGGVTSNRQTATALAQVAAGYERLQTLVQRRVDCMSGATVSCDKGALTIDVPVIEPPTSRAFPRSVTQVVEVRPARDDLLPSSLTVLSQSSCLRAISGPYYVKVHAKKDSVQFPALEYVGDLFFSQLASSSFNNVLAPIMDKGLTYMLYTPTSYYVCPESADDLSRAYAIERIAQIAKRYPSKNPSVAERALASGAHFEQDALSVAHDMLASPSQCSGECEQELIGAYLMYRDHGALLEELVGEVALFGKRDLVMKQTGLPVEVGAPFIFLMHSAFPQFFLVSNPSTGIADVALYDIRYASDVSLLLGRLLRWTQLKDSVLKEKIVHDMKLYFALHQTSK